MTKFPEKWSAGLSRSTIQTVPTDYAIHSDFLVHWTGKDLEDSPLSWAKEESSKIPKDSELCGAYLKRLRDILRYGLWLTEEPPTVVSVAGHHVQIPSSPKVCFTELKLSQSRIHAAAYGRLGIGVKRKFIFDRGGRPLAYFWFDGQKTDDPFFRSVAASVTGQRMLNFFKPMVSKLNPMVYGWYAESEWRILFFEQLLKHGLLVDPRDPNNSDAHDYFKSLTPAQQTKLKYLAPLDGWFQLIIYPSLQVKNSAQKEHTESIRDAIAKIKSRDDDGNRVEGGNWPMEIDLDACRNF